MFTAGYLTLEGFYIITVMGCTKPIDKQTLLHHILGTVNYYAAFVYMGFPLTLGAVFIVIEISTPFVCGRWLLYHHGMKGSIY